MTATPIYQAVREAVAARDAGMNAAEVHADPRLVITIDAKIAEAIESGEVWSANTIRDSLPVVCSGLVGQRVKAASMRKEPKLEKVGEEPSTLKSTHAKPIARWVVAS